MICCEITILVRENTPKKSFRKSTIYDMLATDECYKGMGWTMGMSQVAAIVAKTYGLHIVPEQVNKSAEGSNYYKKMGNVALNPLQKKAIQKWYKDHGKPNTLPEDPKRFKITWVINIVECN